MLLQPASLATSHLKAAFFGTGGSGKTLTSILMAIGLSKERHQHAPIAFVDPEGVEEFVAPICAAEGVPLVVLRSRTFLDMRNALTEAIDVKCCAFVVDHYDGIFRELTEAQKTKTGFEGKRLPYHHREDLQMIWDDWVRTFRLAPLHCLFNGRLAWEWGDDEDDEGNAVKVKLGTKMRGESDAGYEPNLLIEMERHEHFKRDKVSKKKTGAITHVARVLKDRRLALNGLSFEWKDLNAYAPGAYKSVYDKLSLHLGPEPQAVDPRVQQSSAILFSAPKGESAFVERLKRVTIAGEDFKATLQVLWPGTTNDAKACHAAAIEAIFGVRSWAAVEGMEPDRIEEGARVLRGYEASVAGGQAIAATRASVIADLLITQTERKETQIT
jgi:hypothetical protein